MDGPADRARRRAARRGPRGAGRGRRTTSTPSVSSSARPAWRSAADAHLPRRTRRLSFRPSHRTAIDERMGSHHQGAGRSRAGGGHRGLAGELHLYARPTYPPGSRDPARDAEPAGDLLRADAAPTASPSSPSRRWSWSPAASQAPLADPDRVTAHGWSSWRWWCTGATSIAGSVVAELPPSRGRTLDFLNGAGVFFELGADDVSCYINKSRIRLRPPSRLRLPVARLDRLIQVMHEQRADALQLAVGKPVTLLTNGSAPPAHARSADRRPDPRARARDRGRRRRRRPPRRRRARSRFGYRSPSGAGDASRSPGTPGGPLVEVRAAPGAAAGPRSRRGRVAAGAPRAGEARAAWRSCSGGWSSAAPPTSTCGAVSRRCSGGTASWSARTCPLDSGRAAGADAAQHHDAAGGRGIPRDAATPTGPTRSTAWPASAATPAGTATARWPSSGSSRPPSAPPTTWG